MQCPTGNRTRPATRYFIQYPTRFSFENHRVARYPKYRVLPDISGKPEVTGLPGISGITDSDLDLQITFCNLFSPQ